MRLLFLTLLLSLGLPAADDTTGEILTDQQLSTKFVSVIQATRVEDQLIQSSIFAKCATDFKFDAKKTRDQQTDEATGAQISKCFEDEIKKQPAAKIEELSKSMNLQGFQLVRSKNVQDITKFLTARVYKRMTGIDLEEQNMEKKIKAMRFDNPDRKVVDQRDFVELYKIELGKSALYEISRFCFTNLRRTTPKNPETSGHSFVDHWGTQPAKDYFGTGVIDPNTKQISRAEIVNFTDVPKHPFGNLTGGDKQSTYDEIIKSFSKNPDFTANTIKDFFTSCMRTITPLCNVFRDASRPNPANPPVVPATAATPPAPGATNPTVTQTASAPGANACLTQGRLMAIRKAMKDTTVVLADWDSLRAGNSIKLDKDPTFYNERDGQDGYSAVSTLGSDDFLEASDNQRQQRLSDCTGLQGSDIPDDCEGFLVEDDSLKKALRDTDFNLRLKTELELKRIEELKSNKQGLEEYLDKMGYLELKEQFKNNPATFDTEVKNFFDSQRLAALNQIRAKVGSRQLDSGTNSDQDKLNALNENVSVSKSESARLAQVVLFTNIITSSLTLEKANKGGGTTVIGQNTQGLDRERNANSQDNGAFFQNFSSIQSNKGDNGGNILEDISFLDEIIGKPAAP